MSGASVTVFTKVATPGEPTTLSKRISIGADDRVFSDGSACRMAEGIARTVSASDVQTLAHVIGNLGSENALALGISEHSGARIETDEKPRAERHAGDRADPRVHRLSPRPRVDAPRLRCEAHARPSSPDYCRQGRDVAGLKPARSGPRDLRPCTAR